LKCSKLFEKIDDLGEKYLDILEAVCNIESPTDFKKGVDEVGRYFLDFAKEKGWKTEVLPHSISGDVVCITMNPDAAQKPVSLSAHIDTVHPVGFFGTPAVRRDEKNIYGPGVSDCKGGAVVALLAMDALEKCGFTSRPVMLLLQSDEEKGSAPSGKETINYICEKAKDSIAFLNLEPAGTKNIAVLRRKGILRFLITVRGKACHSSKCYEGVNAITEAAYKILQLEKMKDPDGITCNCGVINGGSAPNTVAEECSFYADIRFATIEQEKEARERVRKISEHTELGGCTCTVKEVSYRPMMKEAEKNYNLLEKINSIYSDNGFDKLKTKFAYGGSDAAYVTERGIPCVDTLGPVGGNIHSINEYTEIASITETAKRIAAVIYCI